MKSESVRKVISIILSLSLMLQIGIPAVYVGESTVVHNGNVSDRS